MKKTAIVLTVLVVFSQFIPAAEADKLRVSINNANVRSRPELNAEIVLKAGKDDVFTVVAREGDWYKILIPAETGSQAKEGYIHSGLGVLIENKETPAKSNQLAASSRTTPKRKSSQAAARSGDKLFSGIYAKFGLMTTPAAPFGDRWLLCVGKDWGINPFLAVGMELQPYFRHFSDGEASDSTLGANLFVNAKGGVNLGRFAEKLKILTPYIGVGLGGAFATSNSKLGTDKFSSTDFYFAWHLVFGLEVALKKMSVILELQSIKVAVPEITPDLTQHFMMIGVRF